MLIIIQMKISLNEFIDVAAEIQKQNDIKVLQTTPFYSI
jgi:hypothetical protein